MVKEEGIVISKAKGIEKGKEYIMVSIYNSRDWDRIEEVLREIMEEKRNEYIIYNRRRFQHKTRGDW